MSPSKASAYWPIAQDIRNLSKLALLTFCCHMSIWRSNISLVGSVDYLKHGSGKHFCPTHCITVTAEPLWDVMNFTSLFSRLSSFYWFADNGHSSCWERSSVGNDSVWTRGMVTFASQETHYYVSLELLVLRTPSPFFLQSHCKESQIKHLLTTCVLIANHVGNRRTYTDHRWGFLHEIYIILLQHCTYVVSIPIERPLIEYLRKSDLFLSMLLRNLQPFILWVPSHGSLWPLCKPLIP